MIKHHSDMVLEITGRDPDTLEKDLNTAVDVARGYAMQEGRHGILVTQHDFTSYTVRVSRDVPYGQTHERRETP
jgi:hypothetical protein